VLDSHRVNPAVLGSAHDSGFTLPRIAGCFEFASFDDGCFEFASFDDGCFEDGCFEDGCFEDGCFDGG
jgi:hypothetical protein